MYDCTDTYFLQKETYTQLVYFLFSVTYWARKRLDFQGPNLTNIELAQLLGKVFGITWNKMMPTPDEPQLQVSKKRPGPHFKKNCPPFKSSGKIILGHSTGCIDSNCFFWIWYFSYMACSNIQFLSIFVIYRHETIVQIL